PLPIIAGLLIGVSGFGAAYLILAKSAYVELLPDEVTGKATGLVRTGLRAGQGVGVALGGLIAQWLGSAAAVVASAGVLGAIGCTIAGVSWQRSRVPEPAESAEAAEASAAA